MCPTCEIEAHGSKFLWLLYHQGLFRNTAESAIFTKHMWAIFTKRIDITLNLYWYLIS
jgi:hypothetical protein